MNSVTFFNGFFPSFLATVAGGVVLTLLLFLIKEKIQPMPEITGRWYFSTKTLETAYNPYKNMKLEYVAVIFREGNKIFGTTEKIYEISTEFPDGQEYIEKNRVRGKLEGTIQKNYLKKDKISIHSVENEFSRESTNFYEMIVINENEMKGYFTSMIADQTGDVIWQRKPLLSQ